MRRITLALTAALIAVFGLALTGCSTAEPVELTANTVVIDVRTPEEFASGHLDGAVNMNWEGEFPAMIESLPKDGDYLLYCRSGNRAGQALAYMQSDGFTNVTNLGGVNDASSATGLPIVK